MPVFFQHQINESTRLGIWKIEESEEFFLGTVPQHRNVTHPHKRLQHLAGRFLLQFLFPGFPNELIQIADTRKPFLPDEKYHFSISHCGDFAAAIVSKDSRVGIDIEIPVEKILRIQNKFLSEEEKTEFSIVNEGLLTPDSRLPTLLWSAKESVFKWYGNGTVDFKRHIQLQNQHSEKGMINCLFSKNNTDLVIHYHQFDHLVLAWVVS
ncbi:MAG TPA: 4'-phosphopantetheinyl transferase superfamily protein [Chitinophagaceae bacterium]|nr:4'-phosphopantetheinyl transferase superfamily protein [Chitinophagaceae bacterium]